MVPPAAGRSNPRVPSIDRRSMTAAVTEHQFDDVIWFLNGWGLPAEPKNYEIAYLYLQGSKPALNVAVDAIHAREGELHPDQILKLRQRFLETENVAQRIADIGERLNDEVDQVASMIEAAIGLTGTMGETLWGAGEKLQTPLDRELLRSIVSAVVATVHETRSENLALGSSLRESREDIS